MKDFFQKLTDSIIIVDEQNNIEFANNSFLNNIGYEKRDLDLQEINNIVNVNNNKIYVFKDRTIFKQGIIDENHIQWGSQCIRAIKIIWEKKTEPNKEAMLGERIVNNMKLWVLVRDLKNKVVYVNKACSDSYDGNKEKALNRMNELLANEEFYKMVAKYDEYVIESKGNYVYEIERNNDGIKGYYEINKIPILDEKGEVEYICISIRDVSLYKHIQYKILDNLNLIDGNKSNGSLILNKVDESIFKNFRVIFDKYLNAENFNIWIYGEKRSVLEPYFPTDALKKENEGKIYFPINKEDIEEYISGRYKKIVKVIDENNVNKNNCNGNYLVKYPIINQGEFKGVISMSYEEYPALEIEYNDFIKTICNQIGFIIKYIELSRRINEELEYRENLESELQTFLDVSADIVIKIDETGIKEVGSGCFNVLGWTEDQLTNMNISDLVHPEDREKTENKMNSNYKINEIVTFENRIKCANGSTKWISWRSRNLRHSKGYIFVSGKDITNDKIVKEQQKQIEKSKHLEEVRNEFFANISHEFKTPINMIMTTSQLFDKQLNRYILNTSLKGEMKKHINVYRQNGYRLLRLVNNLIDITKIDAGFYKIRPLNVNVISVIEDIVLSVAEFCEGNKIQLIFDTEVEEAIIACDPDQIERVMLNLLSNAIKYTLENGEIVVNIDIEDDFVVVNVKDTGDGIPKEKLDIIFERFVQGDNTFTRQCEGSGIGLSLVKGLVEMHGGNISVSSEIGVGSIFQFKLPRKTVDMSNCNLSSKEIKQSKIEKCSIEFADIYNL